MNTGELPQGVAQSVVRTPDATAVRTPGGRELSYAGLDRRTTALADVLDDLALGERFATLLDDGVPAVEAPRTSGGAPR